MLREGYIESAKSLINELKLEEFADLDFFTEINRISTLLKNKEGKEAIEWCSLNKSKIKSSLEFELRVQEYISFIKDGDYNRAVEYARENFTDISKKNQEQFQKLMVFYFT